MFCWYDFRLICWFELITPAILFQIYPIKNPAHFQSAAGFFLHTNHMDWIFRLLGAITSNQQINLKSNQQTSTIQKRTLWCLLRVCKQPIPEPACCHIHSWGSAGYRNQMRSTSAAPLEQVQYSHVHRHRSQKRHQKRREVVDTRERYRIEDPDFCARNWLTMMAGEQTYFSRQWNFWSGRTAGKRP